MMNSDDGKILMCGKLLIKLNDLFDEIESIGCILLKKKQQYNSFEFLRITEPSEKMIIDRKLKHHPEQLVTFSMEQPPLYQNEGSDVMYFVHCVDQQTGESSVVKVTTSDFKCTEIYQSKFRIVHFSMQEVESLDCMMNGEDIRPIMQSD